MSRPVTDPLGVWVLKWVVGPILLVAVVMLAVDLGSAMRECRKMADERGYIEAEYVPANSAGIGAKCICRGKRNEDGTVDETAKLVIELD